MVQGQGDGRVACTQNLCALYQLCISQEGRWSRVRAEGMPTGPECPVIDLRYPGRQTVQDQDSWCAQVFNTPTVVLQEAGKSKWGICFVILVGINMLKMWLNREKKIC